MIFPIIITGVLLLLGAAGVHGFQVTRENLARRRQQASDERQAEQARQEADRAEEDMRRTRNPHHYISVQRSLINRLLAPLRERRRQRGSELEQLQADISAAAADVPLQRQLLTGAFLVLLAVLFTLSISQLVPSFHSLADPSAAGPTTLDWVLGLLMAAVEICIAFTIAHALRPKHGWKPFPPKAYAALALLLGGVLIYGQLEWAPLHDTVPLRSELATAKETLVLDQQDRKPQILLTADQQQISQIQGRLPEVTTRDQVMAFAVTLGADLAAMPALAAVGYIATARRRRRLRRRIAIVKSEITALDQRIIEIPVQITYETQQTLARLGIHPDYALTPAAAPPRAPLALPAPTPTDADPAPANNPEAANRPVTSDDLFPPGPPTPPCADGDRRWQDPL